MSENKQFEDEPGLFQMLSGAKSRITGKSGIMYAIIFVAIAAVGIATGVEHWWAAPTAFGVIVVAVESFLWRQLEYIPAVIEKREQAIEEGEDINPRPDVPPGITTPAGIGVLIWAAVWGGICVWGLSRYVSDIVFMPVFFVGTLTGYYLISTISDEKGKFDIDKWAGK